MNTFYHALEASRKTIASFFTPPANMPDGKPLPAIVFNGNVLDAATLQNMFVHETPPTRYEVQSYDCQVINPNYVAEGTSSRGGASGRNMTILVVVSGYVKIGEQHEAEMRQFSETFILVPNTAADSRKGRQKSAKDWLIQSQNFRLVV